MRILLFFSLAVVAWSADPAEPVAPDKVKVYIYPAPSTWGYTFNVYSDQTLLAKIRSKKYYFTAELEPGRHVFHGNGDMKNAVTAVLNTGREYFVACSAEYRASAWIGKIPMPCTLVEPEQGQSVVEKLKPSPKQVQ